MGTGLTQSEQRLLRELEAQRYAVRQANRAFIAAHAPLINTSARTGIMRAVGSDPITKIERRTSEESGRVYWMVETDGYLLGIGPRGKCFSRQRRYRGLFG